jgi:alpha-N-arabinofuranosidase
MRRALVVVLCAAGLYAADATIEIDAARKASYKIPRTIFGTFLEPIGKSIYPGLWAQVLENPSFEENLWSADSLRRRIEEEPALARASQMGLPHPWEPLDYAQGMRYEPRWGDAANSARSLYLMALPGKETGVRQQVYLPVHRVERYTGSLWVKHAEGPAALEVSLRRRNRAGEALARAPLALAGRDWRKYEFTLELKPGAVARLEPVDFVISGENETRALVDQAFLFPADHAGGLDPDMVEMSRALGTPLIRFGGNYTSGYHWRDGVGGMDQRVSMLNQAWGMPEYNHFGTDEFLDFCRRAGAEPQICLNLGSGTPEEAAEWVRYVNRKWGRGGLLWKLGNELWGTFQIGYPTLERVAERTRRFSEAVRAADPQARLIATGQDPDRFREWNARQLALPAGWFSFLATHFVVGNGAVRRRDATPEFVAQSALALPVGLERALRQMKNQIDEAGAGGRIGIAFTEWLFHGPDDRVPRFTNMGGALCTAGLLNTLIRVAGFTPISNMTGLIEFGGIWKKRGRVYGVPAYWAFRMYSTADVTTPVETRATVETYDVTEGNMRIPEIAGVPYLDVVAALNDAGDRLTVFAVNRHPRRDLTARLTLAGFAASGQARVATLAGTSIYQPNDEMRPEAVRPVESSLRVAGSMLEHVFPRGSVTVIELRAPR